MNRNWIIVGAVVLLAGCSSLSGKSAKEQGKAGVESRDLPTQGADAVRPANAQRGGDGAKGAADAGKADPGGAVDPAVVKALPDGSAAGGGASGTRPAAGSSGPDASIKSMLTDPAAPLAKREVYYDFDRFNINPDQQALVEAHGRFLAGHKTMHVRIEGNCDERGSREYNLALGQRRADSVKKAFILLGASEKQIQAVTYGAEKPHATGGTEESWAQNRRSDILYPDFDAKP